MLVHAARLRFVIMDIPDDPGIPILDTLMIIVMILFVLEMIINGIVDYKTYPWSPAQCGRG